MSIPGLLLVCCAVPHSAMLCCSTTCHAVPFCALPCHAILCYSVPSCATPCSMLCCAMLCHVCRVVPCHATLCHATLGCAMPCHAVPCCAPQRIHAGSPLCASCPTHIPMNAAHRGAAAAQRCDLCTDLFSGKHSQTAQLKHLTVFIKQLAANRLGSAEQVGVYTSA